MKGILAGRSILVVEDEMLVLMNIEIALEELDCTAICSASSVTGSLALLAENRFDAAIIDVNLGGTKSYPIADALAQLDIPFVFSTGYSGHSERADLGNRPLLRKPYTRAALVAAFEELLPQEPLPVAA